ncbi:MAG: Glyoxylate reductase [Firmicutes bacterium]|nr:Glyoxylate reductase [Bacillota bacterium]
MVVAYKMLPIVYQRISTYCEVKQWDKREPIPRELLLEWIKDAEGLLVAPHIQVDEQFLHHASKLRVIAQSAVGHDNIDIDACTKRKISVGFTPGVVVNATADLTFGLLLSSTRRIHEGREFVRQGYWQQNKNMSFGVDLFGKTLGIVGMGHIGTAVARRARPFGLDIIYYNRNRRTDEQELGISYSPFNELLARADFIIVLVPLSPETCGMFGREQFAKMQSTAYFINAARGKIVDTEALVEVLVTQKIAYAAMDVTDPEPLPQNHPLLTLPNVLITPHMGTATTETRIKMVNLTVDNLLAGLEGRPLPACVNDELDLK